MSMYAYWLANTGLTVHKLTGLMTEGIGAEELYALQESQMKKIRVLDEKDVEKITQSRRHWDVQEHWGKLQGEGIGFVCVEDARYPQKLRRISATPCAVLYWQAAGRNTKECGNCRGADKKCLWKPDYGETGEGTCTEPDGYHQRHGDGD